MSTYCSPSADQAGDRLRSMLTASVRTLIASWFSPEHAQRQAQFETDLGPIGVVRHERFQDLLGALRVALEAQRRTEQHLAFRILRVGFEVFARLRLGELGLAGQVFLHVCKARRGPFRRRRGDRT